MVCGVPVRPSELEPAVRRGGGRVVDLAGAVTESQLRRIYAASDGALVTRTPGWPEEIGTLFDAARYGVPLVMSDHDPDLSHRLADEPWIRLFRAGEPLGLARALERFAEDPPPRPDRHAAERMGLSSAPDAIVAFSRLAAAMPTRTRRAHPRNVADSVGTRVAEAELCVPCAEIRLFSSFRSPGAAFRRAPQPSPLREIPVQRRFLPRRPPAEARRACHRGRASAGPQ